MRDSLRPCRRHAHTHSQGKSTAEDVWVCCDKCGKWRRLPGTTDPKRLPRRWYCTMNSDPERNQCRSVGRSVGRLVVGSARATHDATLSVCVAVVVVGSFPRLGACAGAPANERRTPPLCGGARACCCASPGRAWVGGWACASPGRGVGVLRGRWLDARRRLTTDDR